MLKLVLVHIIMGIGGNGKVIQQDICIHHHLIVTDYLVAIRDS